MIRSIIILILQFFGMQQKDQNSLLYTFTRTQQIKFGYAVYLCGQLKSLGSWDPLKAVRMICRHGKFWICQASVPAQKQFEYKYFVAPFELQAINNNDIKWLGDVNEKLLIPLTHLDKFSQNNKRQLNIMSFNIRYENKQDRGSYSWNARKQNCCSLILEHFPDVIGVQQPKKNQITYIISQIGKYYSYFGKSRDLHQDQNSGIFIRKDKFLVLQDDYIWINQTQTPGKTGYGACLPRYFTYLVLQPIFSSNKLFMVINTHLDHQKTLARAEGVKLISKAINKQYHKYSNKLNSFFLTGDFNTQDNDPIFKELKLEQKPLQSLRYVLPKNKSDFGQTFNGFRPTLLSFVNKIIKIGDVVVIDHIFTKSIDYQPLKLEVVRVQNMIVSDHYPIVGYFKAKE